MAIQSGAKSPKQHKPLQRKKPMARSVLKQTQTKKKEPGVLRAWLNGLTPKTERKAPTRKERGEITGITYTEMMERDKERCVHCGSGNGEAAEFKGVPFWKRLEGHHITFKSQGGTGHLRNAATACGPPTQSGTCHHWAHSTRAGRTWFEEWRENNLDEEGRIKDGMGTK